MQVSNMHFIIFTKTDWDEPPRMRHQLVHLLLSAGYRVTFYCRPLSPWANTKKIQVTKNFTLIYYREIIHHQLRLLPILHTLRKHNLCE